MPWRTFDPEAMPNNGMHPTADTQDFMYTNGSWRRVMPGVMLLVC